MRSALRDSKFVEVPDHEVDLEIDSTNKFFGSHINLIPIQSAVAGPRLFYGARFMNQAMPLINREAPLVQALMEGDPEGRSFDDHYGRFMGAIRSKDAGTVKAIDPDGIDLQVGKAIKRISLYNAFPTNRKTQISSSAQVKPGDIVKPGQLLASSNYTDPKGTMALGLNALVGLVPYKGHSMDDAMVISESFAKRLSQEALYGHDLDYKRGVKGGKAHFTGLFPQKFIVDQLKDLDEDGVVKVGARINHGDPIALATRPKVISSQTSQLGNLSSHMKNARSDASIVWHHDEPGIVTDVKKLKSGVRINVSTVEPTNIGDKVAARTGQKGTVSLILPDEHMPRTTDGRPMEVLLNPLSIPSRVNNSLVYELALGKIAAKTGKPYRIAGFNGKNDKWYDFVEQELAKHGVSKTEELFDPMEHKKLENPVNIGNLYFLKLHHTSASKASSRGQGSYDANNQPTRGGGETAQAKRLSGLESAGLLSSGAYNILKDGVTVRGEKNDTYWRALRQGQPLPPPNVPFAWHKFHALLNGTGMMAKSLPGGVERLSFWSDRDLDKVRPIEVKTGDLVDLDTLAPVRGGLFDNSLTGANSWGYIKTPHPVINPAAETVVMKLLGLTEKQYNKVLSGEEDLPMALLMKRKHEVEAKRSGPLKAQRA